MVEKKEIRQETWNELERIISENPCYILGIMHSLLDQEIAEQLQAKQQARQPFGKEWEIDLKMKIEIFKSFENLLNKCETIKKGDNNCET